MFHSMGSREKGELTGKREREREKKMTEMTRSGRREERFPIVSMILPKGGVGAKALSYI